MLYERNFQKDVDLVFGAEFADDFQKDDENYRFGVGEKQSNSKKILDKLRENLLNNCKYFRTESSKFFGFSYFPRLRGVSC